MSRSAKHISVPAKLITILFLVASLQSADQSSAQQPAARRGVTVSPKIDQVISGYLTELNGKYRIRVTEVTFKPGLSVAEHHHAGPHVVFVASGELTSVLDGKTTVYRTGDYFYEPGDVRHSAHNRTNSPLVVVSFDILPANWKGRPLIPLTSK